AGRAYLYSLKRSHRAVTDLLDPLFAAERAAPERFATELGQSLAGHCLCAVLYGSVARGDGDLGSDADLLVVVKDSTAARGFADTVQDGAERLVRDGWGAMLEVNVKTLRQIRAMWNTPLLRQI